MDNLSDRPLIAIVDDEPAICRVVARVAEDNGFTALTATNGVDFVRLCLEHDPDILILDLMMPGVDGIELIRELSTQRIRAPIIFMSGQDARVLHTARDLGTSHGLTVLGVLRKPIDMEEFSSLLSTRAMAVFRLVEQDLAKAIGGNELVLHFQPVFELGSGEGQVIRYLEALVRWDHPKRGLLYTDAFLHLADSKDLLADLTFNVLDMALTEIKRLGEEGIAAKISVNLPPALLIDFQLADQLGNKVSGTGIDTKQIAFEVTETAVMENPVTAAEILTRLRLKGFRLMLDDYGTGYSSLLRLYRMPFSDIKIDRAFVMNADEDEEARVILEAMVALAHNLKLVACAEGVETADILEYLRRIGCDAAQGYYLQKPAPMSELMKLLNAAQWA